MTVDIINCDFREALSAIPDNSIDCILTDPPYGETALAWDKWPPGWPSMVRRVLKPTGSMWCFGSSRMFFDHAAEFSEWSLPQDVIWEKHNGSGLFNDRFRRVHELAMHFYRADAPWGDVFRAPQFVNDGRARVVRKKAKPAHWINAAGPTVYQSDDGGPTLMRSVIYCRSEHGRALHPTQKPVGIVEPLLRYACPPGGVVLDIFAGSGTTGVVAAANGMNAILVEAQQEYADVIRRRLQLEVPLLTAGAL